MYNTPALQNTNYDDYNSMIVNTSNKYANYQTTNWSWILYTYNNWDYFYTYYSSNTYVKFSYNFINYWSNGWDWRNFYRRNDIKKKYNSFSSPNLWFGVDSLPWEYFIYYQPRDATWIFYNQDYASWLHTVQLIWDYQLVDRFIYVDSRATVDNVWLVDTANSVAWSTTVDDPYMLSQILFWKVALNDQFFNEFGWDTRYDVNMGWSSFLPATAWNKICNGLSDWKPSVSVDYLANSFACRSSIYANIWLTYQQRYTTVVQPSYWDNEHWSAWNTGSVATWSNDRYNQCLDTMNSIKTASLYEKSCINTIDNDHTTYEMFTDYLNYVKNYSWTWSYTGVMRSQSCYDWINYTTWQFKSWGANYYLNVLHANDRANTEPVDIDSYCKQYLVSSTADQTWLCSTFWVGCDYTFDLSWTLSFVNENILDPVLGLTWIPIKDSFMSWFNYFWIANSCNADLYWKSYSWWNFLLIFCVAWIVFVLYKVLE